MSLPGHLEVFYGATDPTATHVYVRLWADPPESAPGLKLAGVVRGPFNQLARTLPATVPLADQGPGESLLARAVLPDPCFWTPGSPYLYTVKVEIRNGQRVVAHAERMLGIRPLGVAGRRFILGGKGWFPRAIHREIVAADEADDLAGWREVGAVMIARSPSDELCQRASEQGVLLFAELPGDDADDDTDTVGRISNPSETIANEAEDSEIRRLAQWPAIGLVVIPPTPSRQNARAAGRNLLVAQKLGEGVDAAMADCIIAQADVGDQLSAAAACVKPVIAARRYEGRTSLAAARAACDVLQAELAGRVEVAGLALLPPRSAESEATLR